LLIDVDLPEKLLRKEKNENDVRESRAPDSLWLALHVRYKFLYISYEMEVNAGITYLV
jgi:hypothetical protein